jgi:hypothetical protein
MDEIKKCECGSDLDDPDVSVYCSKCRKEKWIKQGLMTGPVYLSGSFLSPPASTGEKIIDRFDGLDENNNTSNQALTERIADLERYMAEALLRIRELEKNHETQKE